MPVLREGCRMTPPVYDHCGCQGSCGSLDCSQNHKVGVGGTCGGFMPYGMANTCEDGLECVNTMGAMIADAPGICQQPCNGVRDQGVDVKKMFQKFHGIVLHGMTVVIHVKLKMVL